MATKLTTEHIDYEIKDGILFAKYADGITITEEVVNAVIRARLTIQNGNTLPAYADCTGVKHVTIEGFQALSQQGSQLLSKVAIIYNSYAIKLLANFYLLLTNPDLPTKIFSDKEKAIKWLKKS